MAIYICHLFGLGSFKLERCWNSKGSRDLYYSYVEWDSADFHSTWNHCLSFYFFLTVSLSKGPSSVNSSLVFHLQEITFNELWNLYTLVICCWRKLEVIAAVLGCDTTNTGIAFFSFLAFVNESTAGQPTKTQPNPQTHSICIQPIMDQARNHPSKNSSMKFPFMKWSESIHPKEEDGVATPTIKNHSVRYIYCFFYSSCAFVLFSMDKAWMKTASYQNLFMDFCIYENNDMI